MHLNRICCIKVEKRKKKIKSTHPKNLIFNIWPFSLYLNVYLKNNDVQWCTLNYLTFYSQSIKTSFTLHGTFFLCKIPHWTEIFFSNFFAKIFFFIRNLFHRFFLFRLFLFSHLHSICRCVKLDWKYHGLIKPTPFVNSTRFLHKNQFCM